MKRFTFEIQQRSVCAGAHSWVAIEQSSGEEIPVPEGGTSASGKNLVGQYPEIADYLAQIHKLSVPLIYTTQIDELQINSDGTTVWTFHRQEAEVIVHDIPRVVFSVTTYSA